MSRVIPFRPADNNYRLSISVDGSVVLFDVRWNSLPAGGWFLDLREQDESPIDLGIKIVLGVNLGRRSTHPFFRTYLLRAFDTSGVGADPGYDELGRRVIVKLFTVDEILEQLP